MTWDNQCEWELDHILPCASFDFTKPEDVKKCFEFKNIQPLWAEDNRAKGNKIDLSQEAILSEFSRQKEMGQNRD